MSKTSKPSAELNRQKNPLKFWVTLVVSVIVLVAALIILLDNLTPNTDDAYVYANVVRVSPQVSGRVVRVYVAKDEPVKKGQKLFKLDDRYYLHEVRSLRAAYVKAIYDVKTLHQSVAQSEQEIKALQAEVALAQTRYSDYQKLVQQGAVSRFKFTTASDNLNNLKAELRETRVEYKKAVINIKALVDGKNAVSREAEANLRKAEFQLEQTLVTSPDNGYITNVTLLPGMYADAGTAAMTFVDRSQWWVIANYKENNMHGLKVGQKAEMAISMYPGKIFHGVVARLPEGVNVHDGVPPVFLPQVDKTPNWIRLAQRFPVWIKLNAGQFDRNVPRVGTTTTAVIYPKGHWFFGVIAKTLLRIKSYLYYLY